MKELYRKSPSLMELVVSRKNLSAAATKVRRNKGAAGTDGMSVWEVEEHIEEVYLPLRQKLLNGTYKPQPVKRVEIPKPNGDKRKLGIPCVRDRVVQQAHRKVAYFRPFSAMSTYMNWTRNLRIEDIDLYVTLMTSSSM